MDIQTKLISVLIMGNVPFQKKDTDKVDEEETIEFTVRYEEDDAGEIIISPIEDIEKVQDTTNYVQSSEEISINEQLSENHQDNELDIKSTVISDDSLSGEHGLNKEIFLNDFGNHLVPQPNERNNITCDVKIFTCYCNFQFHKHILEDHSTVARKEGCIKCGYGTNEGCCFELFREGQIRNDFFCQDCDFKNSEKQHISSYLTCIITRKIRMTYECAPCSVVTNSLSNFVYHMCSHMDVKLKEESSESSEIKTQSFKCKVCNKNFSETKRLMVHLRNHTAVKSYICEFCGRRFNCQLNLDVHIRTHTGEKPFLCTFCGKQSVRKYQHTAHVRIHTGERPYQCKVCDLSFRLRRTFTSHIKTHSAENKPFQCLICNKGFSRRDNLIVHHRSHTGEKPFECHLCSKSYSTKQQLVKHIPSHFQGELFKCNVCDETFVKGRHLMKHLSTHTRS